MVSPKQLVHLFVEFKADGPPSWRRNVVLDFLISLHQCEPLAPHLFVLEVLPELFGKLPSHCLPPPQLLCLLPQLPQPPVEVMDGLCSSLALYLKVGPHQSDEEEGLLFGKTVIHR